MLLERDAELQAVDHAVRGARDGRGGVVLLEGPSGAGKTSLLGALRDAAREAGCLTLTARGAELEHGFAYGTARQLLEPVVVAAGPERRAALTAGAARHALVVLDEDPVDAPEDAGLRALHGLYWLVVNLTDAQPVVLTLDDAHWADEASMRWLAYLVRRAEELPLLVALSSRGDGPASTGAVLEALADDPLTTIVRPRPLSPAAVAAIASGELDGAPHPAFAEAAWQVTRGNPFYLRELLRAARDEGIPPTEAGAGRLGELGPDRVGRSVDRRVRRLGADAVALARAVATLEGCTPLALAARVARLEEDAALTAADGLARAGVLTAGPRLDVVHPIVRAALVERIPLADRGPLHARAAAALVAVGEDVERIAAHLLAMAPGAEAPELDVPCAALLLRAAQHAMSRGEPASAAAYLERALADDGAAELRGEALLVLAQAELRMRDRHAFGRYEAAMNATGDPARRAAIALEVVHRLTVSAEFLTAAVMAERRMADPSVPPAVHRLLSAELLGCELLLAPLHHRVAEHIAAMPPEGERHPAETGVLAHARALFGPQAAPPADAAAALADPRLHELGLSGLLGATVHAVLLADDREALVPVLDAVLATGREAGDATRLIWGSTIRAQLRMSRGDLIGAETDAETAVEVLGPHEGGASLAWVLSPVAVVFAMRGRADEAAGVLERLAPPRPWPAVYQYALLSYAFGAVAAAQGRHEEALRAFRECPRILQDVPYAPEALPWRSAAALSLRALGDVEQAAALAHEEACDARAIGVRRAIGRALGVAGACAGDEAVLREAVVVLRGTDAALDLAVAQVELGSLLRRGGQRVEARDILREGVDGASRCGATVLLEHAREELVAAGARPRRERLGGPDALTASERRVVERALAGATNREIAQTLFLTQKTVETHLSSAYRKLDISSRAQLGEALQPA